MPAAAPVMVRSRLIIWISMIGNSEYNASLPVYSEAFAHCPKSGASILQEGATHYSTN
jgi:hypothetical protein